MIYPDSQVVDTQNNPIGGMQLFDALKVGAILRVARVYIFNESGQLLLQQRGTDVIAPLKWNESASGHVDEGESYESTAIREAQEELGIELSEISQIDYLFTEERIDGAVYPRFQAVFAATVKNDVDLDLEKEEVTSVRWMKLADIDAWAERSPEDFTGGFLLFYKRFRDKKTAAK